MPRTQKLKYLKDQKLACKFPAPMTLEDNTDRANLEVLFMSSPRFCDVCTKTWKSIYFIFFYGPFSSHIRLFLPLWTRFTSSIMQSDGSGVYERCMIDIEL